MNDLNDGEQRLVELDPRILNQAWECRNCGCADIRPQMGDNGPIRVCRYCGTQARSMGLAVDNAKTAGENAYS